MDQLKPEDFALPEEILGTENAADGAIILAEAAVGEADGILTGADDLLEAVQFLLETVQPEMEAAAEVPVEPLPDLEPVAEIVGAIDQPIQDQIEPAIGRIKRMLRKILRIFQRSFALADSVGAAKSTRYQHIVSARSVTSELNAKFGSEWPRDLASVAAEIKTGLQEIGDKISPSDRHSMHRITNDLTELEPVAELINGLRPLHKTMKKIDRDISEALNSKLARGLKRVTRLFKRWEHWSKKIVEGEIRKILKSLGINTDFIAQLKAKLKKYEEKIASAVLSPVKHLEDIAEQKLKPLETSIANDLAMFAGIRHAIDRAYGPMDDLLVHYLALAKQHGVVPEK